jgi:hypothetical protein
MTDPESRREEIDAKAVKSEEQEKRYADLSMGGDPTRSSEDTQLTRRLQADGESLVCPSATS